MHHPELVEEFLFQGIKLKHQELNFLRLIVDETSGAFRFPSPDSLGIEMGIQILDFLLEKCPQKIALHSIRNFTSLLAAKNLDRIENIFFSLLN